MINPLGYKQVPLDPKLVGWFAADKVNNLNTTLPANNATVTNWYDISGRGAIPTQATEVNKPVFNTDVANGQPALKFTSDPGGTNGTSFRTTDANTLSNLNLANAADGFTIFLCAQIVALSPPSSQSGCMLFMQGSSPSSNEVYQITQAFSGSIANSVINSAGFQRTTNSGNAVVNTPFINTFWWDKNSSSIASQFNSNAIVNGSGSVSGLNTNPTLFAIGQQKVGQSVRYFDGKIFELIIYSRFLSSGERESVKQYLSLKYAITI